MGFPKPLAEHFNEDAVKCAIPIFWLNVVRCIIRNYVFTSNEAKLVECLIREQSKSGVWLRQRSGRVTASKFKNAVTTDSSKSSMKFICYWTNVGFFTACKYICIWV